MNEITKVTLTAEFFEKATDVYPEARVNVDFYAPNAEQMIEKVVYLADTISANRPKSTKKNTTYKKVVYPKKTVSKSKPGRKGTVFP